MTTDRELEQMAADVTFDELYNSEYDKLKTDDAGNTLYVHGYDVSEAIFDYQQQRINALEEVNLDLVKKITNRSTLSSKEAVRLHAENKKLKEQLDKALKENKYFLD